MSRSSLPALAGVLALLGWLAGGAEAAGTLTPAGSPQLPIRIREHHVAVVLNNGFARTEVTQVFHNPNNVDLEAVYSFPVPKSASLSEVTICAGEKTIDGEVVEKERARQIYEEERDQGNDTGLAEKDEYRTFQFSVSPVKAGADTRIRFVYYQPLEIDTGVGRYLYPLEDGGTDEAALAFWTTNEQVDEQFSMALELKSAWPVDEVRVPGFADARVDRLAPGHVRVKVERQSFTLDQDFVFYYALAENLPGRVELIPYRADESGPGTFMLVVTPGIDLAPLERGADYVFVLDVSGSMEDKLHTLAQGVARALTEMQGGDRFRVITFSSDADDLTKGFLPVTEETVRAGVELVHALRSDGSTNLFAGLAMALEDLDADRATSIILVTDAVTNTGVIEAKAFHELMKKVDIRVFGFLMGNDANWPLMRTICEASGGFSVGVSNADDVIGQLLLAKSKVVHECLHDAELKISGVKVFDCDDELLGKVYRGQQLVFFGRYEAGGRAEVTLNARLTGQDKTYRTTFDFPAIDTGNPEIERLWAMDRIERLETREDAGLLDGNEARAAIADLGVRFQLVTDHTSMLLLDDASFARHNVERDNRERVAKERAAQRVRASEPPKNRRVDQNQPMFPGNEPSRRGAGAIDPLTGLLALLVALAGAVALLGKRG